MSFHVTVIIPTYNRERTIGRAIKSVLDQTYKNWHLIVVDDKSTDNTKAILDNFKDPRITVIYRDVNGGNAAARNEGLNNATGDFISFLDSDDMYKPDFLARSLGDNDWSTGIGFAWCGVEQHFSDGQKYKNIPGWSPSEKFRSNPYHFFYELKVGTGCGLIFKRKCIGNGLRFDERLRVAVDTDFLVRLRQNYNYSFIVDSLVVLYLQPNSVKTDSKRKMEAYKTMLEKYDHIINCSVALNRKWYYKYMWLCFHNKYNDEGVWAYSKIKSPSSKVKLVYFAFKFFPDIAKRLHIRLTQL